jgi:hypothetical protein
MSISATRHCLCGTAGTPSVAALQRTLHALGVDDKTIQAILRHSNIGTAYIKSVTKSQVSAMDSLSDNLGTCNDLATPAK